MRSCLLDVKLAKAGYLVQGVCVGEQFAGQHRHVGVGLVLVVEPVDCQVQSNFQELLAAAELVTRKLDQLVVGLSDEQGLLLVHCGRLLRHFRPGLSGLLQARVQLAGHLSELGVKEGDVFGPEGGLSEDGLLHLGRNILALALVELFRVVVVDGLAVKLAQHGNILRDEGLENEILPHEAPDQVAQLLENQLGQQSALGDGLGDLGRGPLLAQVDLDALGHAHCHREDSENALVVALEVQLLPAPAESDLAQVLGRHDRVVGGVERVDLFVEHHDRGELAGLQDEPLHELDRGGAAGQLDPGLLELLGLVGVDGAEQVNELEVALRLGLGLAPLDGLVAQLDEAQSADDVLLALFGASVLLDLEVEEQFVAGQVLALALGLQVVEHDAHDLEGRLEVAHDDLADPQQEVVLHLVGAQVEGLAVRQDQVLQPAPPRPERAQLQNHPRLDVLLGRVVEHFLEDAGDQSRVPRHSEEEPGLLVLLPPEQQHRLVQALVHALHHPRQVLLEERADLALVPEDGVEVEATPAVLLQPRQTLAVAGVDEQVVLVRLLVVAVAQSYVFVHHHCEDRGWHLPSLVSPHRLRQFQARRLVDLPPLLLLLAHYLNSDYVKAGQRRGNSLLQGQGLPHTVHGWQLGVSQGTQGGPRNGPAECLQGAQGGDWTEHQESAQGGAGGRALHIPAGQAGGRQAAESLRGGGGG